MARHKLGKGTLSNQNGFFTLPPKESVRETAQRLEEGTNLGWPGSISIHGHMHTSPNQNNKRSFEKDKKKDIVVTKRAPITKTEIEHHVASTYDYALADRSDPFVLARAITHVRLGFCRPRPDGKFSLYAATRFTETKTLEAGKFSDGTRDYQVVSFRNVSRP